MYSAAKSHVVSVLGPPPTRYAVHMTLELNRTASTAEQLNSLLTQIMENFSVSDHEGPLTDEVEAFLNEQEHLTVRRHGDTVVASTDFGKPSRVILAGHLDTVPVIDNFPPKWLEPGDSLIREEIAHAHPEDRVLWGRGATDMKASDAVMLYLAATLDGRTPETTPKVDLTYVSTTMRKSSPKRMAYAKSSRPIPIGSPAISPSSASPPTAASRAVATVRFASTS